MKIERNDKIRITGLLGADHFWAEGTVLSAVNHSPVVSGGTNGSDDPNWYIEMDVTAAHGPPRGYFFWKQGLDGGSIEKITDAPAPIHILIQISGGLIGDVTAYANEQAAHHDYDSWWRKTFGDQWPMDRDKQADLISQHLDSDPDDEQLKWFVIPLYQQQP